MTDQGLPNVPGGLRRRFWYIGDLLVIGLLFAFITYVHSRYWVSYQGGLQNTGLPVFRFAMHVSMMLPLAAILLVILMFRLAISWPKCIRARRRLWTLRGLVIVALGLYAGLFFVRLGPFPRHLCAWLPGLRPRECQRCRHSRLAEHG